jgi:hypothetical protein
LKQAKNNVFSLTFSFKGGYHHEKKKGEKGEKGKWQKEE